MNLFIIMKLFIFFILAVTIVNANHCGCRLKTKNRIVNGELSPKNFIPWIASLAYHNEHICGSSIINEKYILTAAHCVQKLKAEELTVRVGINNIKKKIPPSQTYKVKKIHSNEYKGIDEAGDIAILELAKSIKFIEGVVEKGCFNLEKKEYSQPLLAAGWGMTGRSYRNLGSDKLVYNGKSEKLKHAFFKQIKECEDYLICIKPVVEGDSTCQGDSGGPLHYTENGITTIEGIDSFGRSIEKNNKTIFCVGKTSYSRLSYYSNWINRVVKNSFCRSNY